ncbi:MAG: N-6 DNA methylase [Chloroflexi bacterium]|nr:N-6 DNA methylase [Chloroflexota bacterium]
MLPTLQYKRDLQPLHNLKTVLREIRDYFAGNVTGITRDETIAQTMMSLLFCKIVDEQETHAHELVEFANRPNESADKLARRIENLFQRVKQKRADIFDATESIELAPDDLAHVVSKLQDYALLNADRDIIADAFEELVGTAFRGGEGQFFTPRNVVQMMIEMLDPSSGERIIDPACGSGGFLAYISRHLLHHQANKYAIVGIDKDAFLSRLAKIYLSLIDEKNYRLFCENSLEQSTRWNEDAQSAARLGSFDLILTNPPFGAKIPVIGKELLRQYELGHRWIEKDGCWQRTTELLDKQPPQVLFIERCLQLLKPGGRAGIVLPEGVFGNPSDRYIWEYIRQNAAIMAIVSLPPETFQPSTHTKTSVVFFEKASMSRRVFMAVAKTIGHNKNGKEVFKINPDGSFVFDARGDKIVDDDAPEIARRYKNPKLAHNDHLGFWVDAIDDHIFIPEYYNPELKAELLRLEQSGKYHLVTIGDLVEAGVLEIRRGNEIGSQFYGTGDVPFVRTTDIVNWEIKMDPVKAIAEEVYAQYRRQQDVRQNDILFVNDGTFLIGRTAMITRLDTRIVIQSHLKKIRVVKPESLNPFYLFYLLNSNIAQKQIAVKTFTQATLSTIGNRLRDIILPISNDPAEIERISRQVQAIVEEKTRLREQTMQLIATSI